MLHPSAAGSVYSQPGAMQHSQVPLHSQMNSQAFQNFPTFTPSAAPIGSGFTVPSRVGYNSFGVPTAVPVHSQSSTPLTSAQLNSLAFPQLQSTPFASQTPTLSGHHFSSSMQYQPNRIVVNPYSHDKAISYTVDMTSSTQGVRVSADTHGPVGESISHYVTNHQSAKPFISLLPNGQQALIQPVAPMENHLKLASLPVSPAAAHVGHSKSHTQQTRAVENERVLAYRQQQVQQPFQPEAVRWVKRLDTRYNTYFYVDLYTGVSQWDRPADFKESAAQTAADQAALQSNPQLQQGQMQNQLQPQGSAPQQSGEMKEPAYQSSGGYNSQASNYQSSTPYRSQSQRQPPPQYQSNQASHGQSGYRSANLNPYASNYQSSSPGQYSSQSHSHSHSHAQSPSAAYSSSLPARRPSFTPQVAQPGIAVLHSPGSPYASNRPAADAPEAPPYGSARPPPSYHSHQGQGEGYHSIPTPPPLDMPMPSRQRSSLSVPVAPPMEYAPPEAPPFDAPPFDAPPFDAPPFDAPPFDAPPIDAPPMAPPQHEHQHYHAEPEPEPEAANYASSQPQDALSAQLSQGLSKLRKAPRASTVGRARRQSRAAAGPGGMPRLSVALKSGLGLIRAGVEDDEEGGDDGDGDDWET